MGVPSYFSYIIKNHPQIIKKIYQMQSANIGFKRLYMDCNSILYDSYHSTPITETTTLDEFEKIILQKTVLKIEEYVHKIRPSDVLYIAFDGVAPFAKMNQQRNRRYKSWFQSMIFGSSTNPLFSTSMFTPGTKFMKRLSTFMITTFHHQEKKYNIKKILLATPEQCGEGEHKLYDHLRKFPMTDGTNTNHVAIYGLDADLIMLSLFHLSFCDNIFVFREAPEFMRNALSTERTDIENELWCLDISQLGRSIANEMRCSCPDPHRVYDYVFLCFLLGNDFLPHFPALNIRTNGIQRLLDIYRIVIGNKPKCFLLSETTPPTLEWRQVSKLISSLAKHEHSFILQEYAIRKKWNYRSIDSFKCKTDKEKEETFQSTPILFREEELYISPQQDGWKERYYFRFFREKENASFSETVSKKEICINYLEGLEWVCKYYSSNCPDWTWKYNYTYPPLLIDLVSFVPHYSTTFLKTHSNMYRSFSPNVQLAYVLPKSQLHLLSEKNKRILLEKYTSYYPETNLQFKWAFCRYFWESHVCLPEFSLDMMEILELELN